MHVERLFEPLTVRGVVIPSRVFLAPINTGFGLSNSPSDKLASFHVRRSSSAVGLSYVGNVLVQRTLVPDDRMLVLDDKSDIRKYAELVRNIAARGSLPGIQLAALLPGLN